MDPNNREPDESGHDNEHSGAPHRQGDSPARSSSHEAAAPDQGRTGRTEIPAGGPAPAPVRTVSLVAGEYVLTVNPLDGSEVEACPPGDRPAAPVRRTPEEREELRRASLPPAPSGPVPSDHSLLERQEERERLTRLLARGRSVRVTGPSGSGRSALLDVLATDCAGLAPDGVVRLSGYHRTATDLLFDLYAAVHHTARHRPDGDRLLELVRTIGAVVVLDDIEFGGSALDELLEATPECAFLVSATPDVTAPSSEARLEEVFLPGLSRGACVELLRHVVHRPLVEEEEAWAADLWFESEGLPLRFVQAGALLRQRDALHAEAEAFDEYGLRAEESDEQSGEGPATAPERQHLPLPTLAEAAAPAALLASRLSESARDALRFAVALGGETPHQAHLPALAGDTHADGAVGDLLACGLVTPVAGHYRLAAGVATQLENAGYDEGAAGRAHAAAQHYAWWAGHPSVVPERIAAESDAMLASMSVLLSGDQPGHASAAVLLARTAAPAFAAALSWGAWERALRHGQEAARIAGEVAEEAYFHHELGVLALCNGSLDRARAELEASIGLRGVLADRRGAVAGRRALALVADKAGGFDHGAGGTGATEVLAGARSGGSGSSSGGTKAFGALSAGDRLATVVTRRFGPGGGTGTGKRFAGPFAVLGGARRNAVAAGTGALLVAVLGTVVTLGVTGGDEESPDQVKSEQTADDEGGGLTVEQPTPSSAGPEPSESESGSASPSPSLSPSMSESGSPSAVTPEPSETKSSEGSSGGGSGGGDDDEDEDKPTTKPPAEDPSDSPKPPSDKPTTPTPTPTTSEEESATASGPASPGSSSVSAPGSARPSSAESEPVI